MLNTLFGRLFLASIVILSLCFGFIGYIFNQLIQDTVYAAKQEQLRVQNYALLTSARIGDNSVELPDEQREPLLDEFESGLYGFVSGINGELLWSSYSAHTLTLDNQLFNTTLNEPGQFEYQVTDEYFIYRYIVRWELETDNPQLLVFTILEDTRPTRLAIQAFQQRLHRWLVAIALGLIITLLLILRWGTKPLRQLATNLKHIESGHSTRLEGQYPVELRGVASNLNQLIDSERQQRERYHTTMADLAHSLKTPLAVIQAELTSQQPLSPQHQLIADQSQRMDEIIKHQLQRAVTASSHQLAEAINIEQCVDRIIAALQKVYASKTIQFDKAIAPALIFKGDQRDLMEILGNVLDNACKACRNTIKIEAQQQASLLNIAIHDDGAGIDKAAVASLVKRGQRADTRHQGQGIGLDIVRDIVANYRGEFNIEQSPLGGALIRFSFTQRSV